MPEENKFPPLLEQISNLTKALKVALIGFLRTGEVKAKSELQQKRMLVCLACDKLSNDFRCQECGCFVKAKSALLTQDCPLRKWPHE